MLKSSQPLAIADDLSLGDIYLLPGLGLHLTPPQHIAALVPYGLNAFYHLFEFDQLIASLIIRATHLFLFLLSRRPISYIRTLRSQL